MKERNLTTNQQLALNLSASFITYAVTFAINFFLSPYIVRTVGVEAHGFVGLAGNFISYVSLITIALNALAGRFITVHIYKNDYETANKYYSSVFYANIFLSAVMLVIEVLLWLFLEKLINIPDNLFWDVKILFASLFLNSILGTAGSIFSVSIFATNKLYLGSVRSIESSVARAIVLVLVYLFMAPRVSYLGISSFFVTLYCTIYNYYYMKKLTPFLKIKKSFFDMAKIILLVKSGVWSLITRIGQMFSDGLDLLITNVFIDATSMGVLSLAKTLPTVITGIIGTMVNAFSPNFTILYAQEKHDELVAAVKQSMKIMGVICNLPIIVIIICGEQFYKLWQPTQNAHELYALTLLTCIGVVITGGINCIFDIFTVVNKLRYNSLVLLFSSMLSIAITFVLVKTTDLGIYAVAGVSTVIMVLKNLILIIPYAAKCLKLKWYTFYPDVIRPVIFVFVSSFINFFLVGAIKGNGWINLIICCAITGIISLAIGYFIILNKSDRAIVNAKLMGVFGKIKGR